jgi:hypothetical protein
MAKEQVIVYPTKDGEKAKKLFTSLLGTEPYMRTVCFGYANQSASLPEVGQDTQPRPVRWLTVRVLGDSGAVELKLHAIRSRVVALTAIVSELART